MNSILFVTDAWAPQVNGVVRTLEYTIACLRECGVRVEVIEPGAFASVPAPSYPEIRLSLTTRRRVGALIDAAGCAHIHIATEGPLGMLAAAAARRRGRRYTTCYHTRFPEYLAARAPVPMALSYAWLRRFHNRSAACMVATERLKSDLQARDFKTLRIWPRGVDTAAFHPGAGPDVYAGLPRPIWLTVGRVAVEKSVDAFLDLPLGGTKVVVGDGPALPGLRARYPDAVFAGARTGAELAAHYSGADVFVFPSRTETFGLVLLEALASGLPVAAFPVHGPIDIVTPGETGILSTDLAEAARAALSLSREQCRAAALNRTWQACTDRFVSLVTEAEGGPAR